MAGFDPYQTFNDEVERIEGPLAENRQQKSLATDTTADDWLQPITNVPLKFSRPMCEPLLELFQDMFLPGLDSLGNNSLIGASTNAAFIEAYMIGLNHELTRELLWREYPTHLDNTFFSQFWDVRGSADPTKPDIAPINEWTEDLGKNLLSGRGQNLFMLLIKGDLLLRYPNTVIYVQRASKDVNDPASVLPDESFPVLPMLRINPVPGVTLLGFELDPPPNAVPPDDPGWFFVIEEHPTEARFGLDISRSSGQDLNSWRELTWDDVQTTNDYISINNSAPNCSDVINAAWGKNSAHMAYITLQKAYRFQVHSSYWWKNEG